MADTIRTEAQLLVMYADNESGLISAQDLRDFVVSVELPSLEALKNDSMVDNLHRHSELSASDGTPDRALSVGPAGKVSLSLGAGIDEFSTDGAMLGDSDIAVPTEKAVVTYAGNAVALAHIQNTDTDIAAVATKNPPIDADKVVYRNSVAGDILVTSTWTQVKAFLKTYFDTLYNLYIHPNHSGDVTSVADGAQTIVDKKVTLAKMNDMATASLLGRNTAGVGVPEVLSKATSLSLLNVEDGSEVNNISDANATDLTDGGDTILHDHDGITENTNARHTQNTDSILVVNDTNITITDAGVGGAVAVTADGTSVAIFNALSQRVGITGDTQLLMSQVGDTMVMSVGAIEVIHLAVATQVFGVATDTNITLSQAGNSITFEAANVTEAAIGTGGLTLKSGASVNEFSTDGTLGGNSDIAVPTELAVKTYIDSNAYYPDHNEADQGVTGDGKTIKAFVDIIGADKATIHSKNTIGNSSTTYTLTTSETTPENIKIVFENGAVIDGVGTLTIEGELKAGPYQIFGPSITVVFGATAKGTIYPHMWDDDVADGITNASIAINKMLASLPSTGGVDVYFPNGTYKCDDNLVHTLSYPLSIEMGLGVHFTGMGDLLTNITNTNNKIAAGTYRRVNVLPADDTRIGVDSAIQTGVWEISAKNGVDDAFCVAGYFGGRAEPGSSADIWGINPLVELLAGSTGNAIGVEVNVGNLTAVDGKGNGVVIRGGGQSLKGYAIDINSANDISDWTNGIKVADFVDGIVVDGTGSTAPVRGIRVLGLSKDHLKIESSDDLNPANAHAFGVDSGLNVMWSLRKGGVVYAKAGFTLDAQAITEFSTDGTLAGNSDAALPTEQAVKEYVATPKADINMGGTYQVVSLQAPAANGEAIRQTASITETNLTTLTDNSIADTLHRHSELVASDGSPDPALSVDVNGNVWIGNGFILLSDEVRARDSGGLYLRDDSGTLGIFVKDGGCVGIGTDTPTQKLEVHPDSDNSAVIGRAHVGSMGFADHAGFSHVDQNGGTGYALLQDASGTTYLNAPTGQKLDFRINSVNIATLDVNAFYGATGIILAADKFRQNAQSTPASAGADGAKGDIKHDTNYIYVCTATNTWKRTALSTW